MIHKDLVLKYYKKLINSLFKILPIFEGVKYKTTEVIYSKEQSFRNYQVYLTNLLIEIHGNSQLFFKSENSIKLVSILNGMLMVEDHETIKRLTMECINLCKKISKEIEKEE